MSLLTLACLRTILVELKSRLTLSTVGLGGGNLLELLHKSVGDGHTGELGTSTVGTHLRVTTETRDLGKVEVEVVDEPVDGVTGAVGENLDEVVTSKVTGGLLGVGKELGGGVGNVQVLGLGLSTR